MPLVRDPLFFDVFFFFFFLWLTPEQRLVADRRGRELARIRQIFIPELILRLHALLVSSRKHIPECVLRFFFSLTRAHASSWPTHQKLQQRPACLAFGECRRRFAVHVIHRVCGGEWTEAEGVFGCCPYCSAGGFGTRRIGSI